MKYLFFLVAILFNLFAYAQYAGSQLILCNSANKSNCDSVTRISEFKMNQGSAHVCCIIKGIFNTSSIKMRIRLRHHSDVEFTVSDYVPSDTRTCVYQDILIWNRGKHEIELLDDKGARILIESFVVH